jgi:hypothetical protein
MSVTVLEEIRTHITPGLLRFALFRGTLMGGIGAAILLFSGIFLPPALLQGWGFFLFMLSIGLIAWGLIPYRRLKRLETNPNRLILDSEGAIHFLAKGKVLQSIPREAVKSLRWVEKRPTGWFSTGLPAYGIEISLPQKEHSYFFPYFGKAASEKFILIKS